MSVITTQPGSTALIVGNKPSVLDAVTLIGRKDAPLLSAFGKGKKVSNVLHSWIVDNVPEPEYGNFLEIDSPASAPASTKQRTSNAVEITKHSYGLSFDQLATENYGEAEKAHQRKLAMIKQAKTMEGRILGLGRNASGKVSVLLPYQERSDTVPGKAAGIFYYLTLNEPSFTPGTDGYGWRGHIMAVDSALDWTGTLTDINIDMLDAFVGKAYDSGASVTDLWVGRDLKRSIMHLFDRSWDNQKTINYNYDVIELSCGKVRVHLHHMLSEKYGLNDVAFACDPAFFKVRPLYEVVRPLPEQKTAKLEELYISWTLQVTNATQGAILVGAK